MLSDFQAQAPDPRSTYYPFDVNFFGGGHATLWFWQQHVSCGSFQKWGGHQL